MTEPDRRRFTEADRQFIRTAMAEAMADHACRFPDVSAEEMGAIARFVHDEMEMRSDVKKQARRLLITFLTSTVLGAIVWGAITWIGKVAGGEMGP